MIKGKVNLFKETKGFGFIQEDNTATEYFMHASGLFNEVGGEDMVEFDLKEGKKE